MIITKFMSEITIQMIITKFMFDLIGGVYIVQSVFLSPCWGYNIYKVRSMLFSRSDVFI